MKSSNTRLHLLILLIMKGYSDSSVFAKVYYPMRELAHWLGYHERLKVDSDVERQVPAIFRSCTLNDIAYFAGVSEWEVYQELLLIIEQQGSLLR